MSTGERIPESARRKSGGIVSVLLLGSLVGVLYAPVLKGLVRQWWDDPNYSHGFAVPLFSVYVLWRGRERLRKTPSQPNNYGLLGMVSAIGLLMAGTLGAELFLSRCSSLALLGGMIVFLAGLKTLRVVAFPLSYLMFSIPLPAIIYYQITLPLELLASRLADACLELVDVPALRDGNVLILPNYTLEVADACSGIRSLFSLLALAVGFAYLAEGARWKRLLLVLVTIPMAIVSNALRLVGTGVLTYHFGAKVAEGFFHSFSGWVVFLVSLGLMLLAHGTLRPTGREVAAKPC